MIQYEKPKTLSQLQAENAKLRERIHELEMEGSDHFYRTAYAEDANRTLEAENAKLRELVWDMWNGMCGYAHECRSCEHYELYEGQRFVGECEYHRRMRELGIEDE